MLRETVTTGVFFNIHIFHFQYMLDMADLLDFMTEIMDTTWYLQKHHQLGGETETI